MLAVFELIPVAGDVDIFQVEFHELSYGIQQFILAYTVQRRHDLQ